MNASHLTRGIAERTAPPASGGTETGAQVAIDDEWLESIGHCEWIAGRRQHPA
jgi:hypothetical protein